MGISCRFCRTPLSRTFVDLGMSPLCQTQIAPEQLSRGENFYPLHAYVCEVCFLVQLDEFVAPDVIFNADYPYYSSYSPSWVEHARKYVEQMQDEQGISEASFVVEIASNDGYLLQHFVNSGIRCLGIEPTEGTAKAAMEKGVPSVPEFFGSSLAETLVTEHGKPDLILGNNVLAHVPDLNDFVGGLRMLLASDGFCTFEFPHLMKLVEFNQFDTIYHEHFSYFSLTTVKEVFEHHGLELFDVEQLPTHGGSLRIYAQHSGANTRDLSARVPELLAEELRAGVRDLKMYAEFESKVHRTKRELLRFLIEKKHAGHSIVGYGAPGKGITLLNFCGIGTDFLDYTVDRNPMKQGTYTPGTRIPILDPKVIEDTKPDFVLILPWNLRNEIASAMEMVRTWGGKFVVPIPRVEVF